MKIKNAIAITALALGFGALSAPAQATSTYGFSYLGSAAEQEPSSLSGQLALDVDFTSTGTALLKVRNDGLGGVGSVSVDDWIASNLAEIYFYSTNQALVSSIGIAGYSGSGVNYQSMAVSPGDLPGFDRAGYYQTFAVDSDCTKKLGVGSCDGVNQYGEWVQFAATLGNTFGQLDILNALASGDFRVGIHVRSIAGAGSDSYITPLNPVPLPAAAWLFGSALLGFVSFSVRRKA